MAPRLVGPVIYADVPGENACAALAAYMIGQSREFHVDPMPGDVWRFWLKDEDGNARLLPGTVKRFHNRPRPTSY